MWLNSKCYSRGLLLSNNILIIITMLLLLYLFFVILIILYKILLFWFNYWCLKEVSIMFTYLQNLFDKVSFMVNWIKSLTFWLWRILWRLKWLTWLTLTRAWIITSHWIDPHIIIYILFIYKFYILSRVWLSYWFLDIFWF